MLEFIILAFTSLANILLGLVVFLKNPRGLTNRLFLFLTASFVIWSIVNFMSIHPAVLSQLTLVRLVLFWGGILNLAVFLAILAFPNYSLKKNYKKRTRAALAATAIVLPLTMSPAVFRDMQIVNGEAQPVVNPGIGLFLLHTVVLLGSSFIILLSKYINSRGDEKNQLRLVLFAIIGTLSLIITTNFLLVVVFNITAFVPYGPAFTLIFSSAMAYAIIRHKLFDIRLIIARALGYILSLGSFIGLYIFTVYIFTKEFLNTNNPFIINQLVPLIAALILVLIYPRFKLFFDRLTNQIFYQDAYDPQRFLDELNKSIVTDIELGILLRHTTEVIQRNLKCDFCAVEVCASNITPGRSIGTGSLMLDKQEGEFVFENIARSRQKMLLSEDIEPENHKLKKILLDNEIGVIIRLAPVNVPTEKTIAYLIIGTKKSGNTYNKQDIRILEIISDEMLIAIQNSLRFEEIQGFAARLQKEVNDATAKLQKSNRKLRALDETKDEFISMASHQLRTPLTSVKGYMSMVLEGDAGKLKKQQQELLSQAFVSSQRMVYLIADLLNVSRLKTGKFIIEKQPISLAKVVEGEIAQLKQTAKIKGLSLEYSKPGSFPDLMLDETKIRQVIMNFADNAIYYTPSGGKIQISLHEDGHNVYFKVKDNGLGVPKDEGAKIFQKFYRASNAKKARPDGTGLGLFMAKKVIDAQGGSLIFASTEGKGSTFGFTFNKKSLAVKST
ncbi:hypothetical protein KY385_04415 [Candidatus Parcubacteria bacterium]|nr:hypothetical protein [Candidatus Parcubacteria bacterium]